MLEIKSKYKRSSTLRHLLYLVILVACFVPVKVMHGASITTAPRWGNVFLNRNAADHNNHLITDLTEISYIKWKNGKDIKGTNIKNMSKVIDVSPGIKELDGEHGQVKMGTSGNYQESLDTLIYPTGKGPQWIIFGNIDSNNTSNRLKVTINPKGKVENPKNAWIGISYDKFLTISTEHGAGETEVTYELLNGSNTPITQNYSMSWGLNDPGMGIRVNRDSEDILYTTRDNHIIIYSSGYPKEDFGTVLTYADGNIRVKPRTMNGKDVMPGSGSLGFYYRQTMFTLLNKRAGSKSYSYTMFSDHKRAGEPYTVEHREVMVPDVQGPVPINRKFDKVEKNQKYSFEFVQNYHRMSRGVHRFGLDSRTHYYQENDWAVDLSTLPKGVSPITGETEFPKEGNVLKYWEITDENGNIVTHAFKGNKYPTDNYHYVSFATDPLPGDNAKVSELIEYFTGSYHFKLPVNFDPSNLNEADIQEVDGRQYVKIGKEVSYNPHKVEISKVETYSLINIGYRVNFHYLDEHGEDIIGKTADNNSLTPFEFGRLFQDYDVKEKPRFEIPNYDFVEREIPNDDFLKKDNPEKLQFYQEYGNIDQNVVYKYQYVPPMLSWDKPIDDKKIESRLSNVDISKIPSDSHVEKLHMNAIHEKSNFTLIVEAEDGTRVSEKKNVVIGKKNDYGETTVSIPKSKLKEGTNKFTVRAIRSDGRELNIGGTNKGKDNKLSLQVETVLKGPESQEKKYEEVKATTKPTLSFKHDLKGMSLYKLDQYKPLTWEIDLSDVPKAIKPHEESEWVVTDESGTNRNELFEFKKEGTSHQIKLLEDTSLEQYKQTYTFDLPISVIEDESQEVKNQLETDGNKKYLATKANVSFYVKGAPLEGIGPIKMTSKINLAYGIEQHYLLAGTTNTKISEKEDKYGLINQPFAIEAKEIHGYTYKEKEPTDSDVLLTPYTESQTINFYYEKRPPVLAWDKAGKVFEHETIIDIESMGDKYKEDVYVNTIIEKETYLLVIKKGDDVIGSQSTGDKGKKDEFVQIGIEIPKEKIEIGRNEFSIGLFSPEDTEHKKEHGSIKLVVDGGGTLKFSEAPDELKWTGRKMIETKGLMNRDDGNDMTLSVSDTRPNQKGQFSLMMKAEFTDDGQSSPFGLKWKEGNDIKDIQTDAVPVTTLKSTEADQSIFTNNWDSTMGIVLSSDTYVVSGDYSDLMKVVWTLADIENPD